MSDYRAATEEDDQALVEDVIGRIGLDRLMRAIGRIAGPSDQDDAGAVDRPALWVPFRGTMTRLPIDEILMIEADRDYVRLHDRVRSYLLRATISGIASRLGDRFLRIHRSSIVARDRVTALRHMGKGRWVAVVDDERVVPVGRKYLDEMRAVIDRRTTPSSDNASRPRPDE